MLAFGEVTVTPDPAYEDVEFCSVVFGKLTHKDTGGSFDLVCTTLSYLHNSTMLEDHIAKRQNVEPDDVGVWEISSDIVKGTPYPVLGHNDGKLYKEAAAYYTQFQEWARQANDKLRSFNVKRRQASTRQHPVTTVLVGADNNNCTGAGVCACDT